jgi:hypothetical protein
MSDLSRDDDYWVALERRRMLDGMTPEQRRNNPNGERMGPYSGRCGKCGSKNLWEDNLVSGCNNCGRASDE